MNLNYYYPSELKFINNDKEKLEMIFNIFYNKDRYDKLKLKIYYQSLKRHPDKVLENNIKILNQRKNLIEKKYQIILQFLLNEDNDSVLNYDWKNLKKELNNLEIPIQTHSNFIKPLLYRSYCEIKCHRSLMYTPYNNFNLSFKIIKENPNHDPIKDYKIVKKKLGIKKFQNIINETIQEYKEIIFQILNLIKIMFPISI